MAAPIDTVLAENDLQLLFSQLSLKLRMKAACVNKRWRNLLLDDDGEESLHLLWNTTLDEVFSHFDNPEFADGEASDKDAGSMEGQQLHVRAGCKPVDALQVADRMSVLQLQHGQAKKKGQVKSRGRLGFSALMLKKDGAHKQLQEFSLFANIQHLAIYESSVVNTALAGLRFSLFASSLTRLELQSEACSDMLVEQLQQSPSLIFPAVTHLHILKSHLRLLVNSFPALKCCVCEILDSSGQLPNKGVRWTHLVIMNELRDGALLDFIATNCLSLRFLFASLRYAFWISNILKKLGPKKLARAYFRCQNLSANDVTGICQRLQELSSSASNKQLFVALNGMQLVPDEPRLHPIEIRLRNKQKPYGIDFEKTRHLLRKADPPFSASEWTTFLRLSLDLDFNLEDLPLLHRLRPPLDLFYGPIRLRIDMTMDEAKPAERTAARDAMRWLLCGISPNRLFTLDLCSIPSSQWILGELKTLVPNMRRLSFHGDKIGFVATPPPEISFGCLLDLKQLTFLVLTNMRIADPSSLHKLVKSPHLRRLFITSRHMPREDVQAMIGIMHKKAKKNQTTQFILSHPLLAKVKSKLPNLVFRAYNEEEA